MSLPPGWDAGKGSSGRTFYVNHTTQQTQWDPPRDAPPSYVGSAPTAPSYKHGKDSPDDRGMVHATVVPTTQYVTHAPQLPQASQYVQHVQQPQVIMMPAPGTAAPGNAPQGGQWVQEKYCGVVSWLIGLFVFPCICCCPCDDRTVYIVNNTRYNHFGAIVPGGCC